MKEPESLDDKLSRVELMSLDSRGNKWDLSMNDRAALKTVLVLARAYLKKGPGGLDDLAEPAQEETPNCPECHRPMTPIRDGEWSCRWGHSLLPNSAPVSPAPAQTERHVFRCWQDDLRGSVIYPDHTPERCREQGHHCNVCHLSFDDPGSPAGSSRESIKHARALLAQKPETETETKAECHHMRWVTSVGEPSVCTECGARFDDKLGWVPPPREETRHEFECGCGLNGCTVHLYDCTRCNKPREAHQ